MPLCTSGFFWHWLRKPTTLLFYYAKRLNSLMIPPFRLFPPSLVVPGDLLMLILPAVLKPCVLLLSWTVQFEMFQQTQFCWLTFELDVQRDYKFFLFFYQEPKLNSVNFNAQAQYELWFHLIESNEFCIRNFIFVSDGQKIRSRQFLQITHLQFNIIW